MNVAKKFNYTVDQTLDLIPKNLFFQLTVFEEYYETICIVNDRTPDWLGIGEPGIVIDLELWPLESELTRN